MEEIIKQGSLRLLATESSCDVVLSCPGYKLTAHRVILSIASPVLQELLEENPSQPALIILPDISPSIMTQILSYMYSGQASVHLEELGEFLSVAALLKLRLDDEFRGCKPDDKSERERVKKAVPGLIPIREVRRRGVLQSKVIPSPWTSGKDQVFEDPRIRNRIGDLSVDCNNNSKVCKNENNNNVEICKDSQENGEISQDFCNKAVEMGEEMQENAEEKIVQEKSVKAKPYVCNDCGKSFSQMRNFKYHRSVHDGTKEFSAKCPECGKVFNDRAYLSSHMKIHRDRKEYACQHCPKRFNQRVAYNMHIRIHTGVKPHECGDCGKCFSRKMMLKQHQRVHTGERPYVCSDCGKSFADRSNMVLHTRLHTGVKPYSCSICPKSFTKKHHLKTHMNFHTGLKPYTCSNCGLAFSQSSNMRTHHKKCILKTPEES